MFVVVVLAPLAASAQVDASNRPMNRDEQLSPPKNFREMAAKQRLDREKKEHEELINRAEKALAISEQLETSFEANNQLSKADLEQLAELENIVNKIRKDLGGSNDGEDRDATAEKEDPSTQLDAFRFLQENTVKLVDEIKKNTRYTVSVVAIQSSNAVLKMVRFLRLRK
jgi:hypothetical protein